MILVGENKQNNSLHMIIPLILASFSLIGFSFLIKKQQAKKMQAMTPQQVHNELETLIASTKGKFFSIQFVKNDGSVRTINGKDKYQRLTKGGVDNVRHAGFVPFVDRNRDAWACAHKDQVVRFECGDIKREMKVSG